MRNQNKTKEQLIDELEDLRKIIAESKKSKTEYKKIEQSLEESREKYKNIAELITDGIITIDLKGVVTSVNNAFLELTGFPRDKIAGRHFSKLPTLRVNDIPRYIKLFSSMIMGKIPEPLEFLWIHKDGTERWGEIYFCFLRRGRKKVGIQAILKDITERKRAEETLQESEMKYRALFEYANDPIFLLDLMGYHIAVNEKAADMLGYSIEELIGKSIKDIVASQEYEEAIDKLKCLLEGKIFSPYERIFRKKDGTEFPVEINVSLVFDPQKKPLFVQSIVRDITERKKAEEALRDSEEKISTILKKSPIPTAVGGSDGSIISFNEALETLIGYKRSEINDTTDWAKKLYPNKKYREFVEKNIKQALIGDKQGCTEFTITCKDGSIKVVDFHTSFFKDGLVIQMVDITERKKTEEEKERLQAQLIHSEKMAGIGTLTGGIAHEFNNLLQIMSGHAEFAQRTKKPEDMEEALEIVGNTSDRVSKIIKDLLSFSRREPLERKHCHIAELVEFVLSMTEEQLKKHNIKVVREYRKTLKVEVNKGELQQVFLNMVTNARDAMLPKGGRLAIKVKKVKDNVEVSFADTGIGIESENLSKVFEPFYTTKGAVGGDTRIQGIGLGLSVSYGIVERHGGTIEVESKVGKGTTFTIRLPAKVEKAKERVVKEKSKPKAKMTKPRSVLVVDDEEEICKMFTKWLSTEGHNVKSSTTGKKALDLVKKESFDIVFLDIVMPGIPAIDTLAEMKGISLKTKIFMITGKLVDKELWKELKAEGASGYLQKPFKIEDIKNCLAKIRD